MDETTVPAKDLEPGDEIVFTIDVEGVEEKRWIVRETFLRADVFERTVVGLRPASDPGGTPRTVVFDADEQVEVIR